ncbi:MAG: bifunctional glutamate N-acetyltransferase/amino-acid acetyltransferase ArgJ [Pseudomonadales bacterium]|nr:bifunctional glutamate N-acetyltransferase/amino-acid acetyltransferase ArgJ [Pseudomonadales bacterium]
MAVGLEPLPALKPIAGVRIAVVEAGVRYKNRRDLVLFELAASSVTAAVFTQNAFCAAPVHVARHHLDVAAPRYLLINTGNANAGTGQEGLVHCRHTCNALAKLAGEPEWTVLPFSTGVIGETLPAQRIVDALPQALQGLKDTAWNEAAIGIMTTDTLPKGGSRQFEVAGQMYTLTGIAKGAGMIRPNMATMLSFLATDMAVDKSLLQSILSQATQSSFNRITIDGDTSTNDACVLVATGAIHATPITDASSEEAQALSVQVQSLMLELAQMIVRDGEGATKFITVHVLGGGNTEECCDVAYAVAHSPLVKTAFFASDPNWGRILAAIGRAGVPALDVNKVQVWLNDLRICWLGAADPEYREALGAEVMKASEITVRIDLGRGAFEDRVYTCDFSYDYVKINADYRS